MQIYRMYAYINIQYSLFFKNSNKKMFWINIDYKSIIYIYILILDIFKNYHWFSLKCLKFYDSLFFNNNI